jgi:hypothetical protein
LCRQSTAGSDVRNLSSGEAAVAAFVILLLGVFLKGV